MKLLNAFSLNMLDDDSSIEFSRITSVSAQSRLKSAGFTSFIGHADMAQVVADELCIGVPVNRQSCTLISGETAIVAQYTGPRLPEGATTLPEGANIIYWLVEVV